MSVSTRRLRMCVRACVRVFLCWNSLLESNSIYVWHAVVIGVRGGGFTQEQIKTFVAIGSLHTQHSDTSDPLQRSKQQAVYHDRAYEGGSNQILTK